MAVLDDLRTLGILDDTPDEEFDKLIALTARVLGSPVALFSIIDEENDRQFFKSATGPDEPWLEIRETPLSHSICKLVKADEAPVIIPDTRKEPRLAGNRAAADLNAIAYLGAPVRDGAGEVIGALCVIEGEPRAWNGDDLDALLVLADAVSGQLRLRFAVHRYKQEKLAAEANAALLGERDRSLADIAANLPGAIFQYRLYPDGRDEV